MDSTSSEFDVLFDPLGCTSEELFVKESVRITFLFLFHFYFRVELFGEFSLILAYFFLFTFLEIQNTSIRPQPVNLSEVDTDLGLGPCITILTCEKLRRVVRYARLVILGFELLVRVRAVARISRGG